MPPDAAFVSLIQTVRRWLCPGKTVLVGMIGLPGRENRRWPNSF